MYIFGFSLALLVGIRIFEEGIGEFMDLGVVHLNGFTSERLLHDPVVAHYDVPIRIKCCNNIIRLDGLFCQRCLLLETVGCRSPGP